MAHTLPSPFIIDQSHLHIIRQHLAPGLTIQGTGRRPSTAQSLHVASEMSGFFGFDTSLPPQPQGGRGGLGGFAPSHQNDAFGGLGAAEEEDVAVYTWGQTAGGEADEMNDETFGDMGGFRQSSSRTTAPFTPQAMRSVAHS